MSNKTETIATLNDLARTAMGIASRAFATDGVNALSPDDLSDIRQKVETYDDFSSDNNPYGEREFGSFQHRMKPSSGRSTITI